MVVLVPKLPCLNNSASPKKLFGLQEHFLSNDSRNIFDALPSHMVHFVPAKNLTNEGGPRVDLLR